MDCLRIIKVVIQQTHVASVCFPKEIEDGADDGDDVDNVLHEYVNSHAQNHACRAAEQRRAKNHVERNDACDEITGDRHEAKNRIPAEAVTEGPAKMRVHHFGDEA